MRRMFAVLAAGLAGALVAGVVVVAVPAEGAPSGGGPGDPLLLSRVNQAGPMTVLKSNGGFRILAKNPKRPPLMVYTPASMAPLEVSSQAKVANLNVDLLDGLDSTAFVRGTRLLAAYDGGDQSISITTVTSIVRSVSLTPPVAGIVIVSATANVEAAAAGDVTMCSIVPGRHGVDSSYLLRWVAPGSSTAAQLSGTRGFPVAGGSPFTANLVCNYEGFSMSSTVNDSSMTAIFIPNP